MNNQEKFQKTFEKVCASPDVLTEVLNMTSNEKVIPIKKKRFVSKFAAVAATLAVIIGTGSIAYAKDVGGIQRVVQIWVHGDQTNATWTIEDGTYTLDYEDTDEKEKTVRIRRRPCLSADSLRQQPEKCLYRRRTDHYQCRNRREQPAGTETVAVRQPCAIRAAGDGRLVLHRAVCQGKNLRRLYHCSKQQASRCPLCWRQLSQFRQKERAIRHQHRTCRTRPARIQPDYQFILQRTERSALF